MRVLPAWALVPVLLTLLLPATVSAAGEELKIQADSLQIDESKGQARFEGSVSVKFQTAELSCNSLVVFTTETSRIRSGIAQGDVVLVRMGDRAEAQRADFDLSEGTVILTGSPRLIRGGDRINSARISYNVNTGVAVFEGPVDAVIIPSSGGSQ